VQAARRVLARHPTGADDAGTLCHGDLWPSQVFAAGAAITGFVDFESIGFASPANDLAQLLVHFGGWQRRDAVLAAYQRARPLPAEAISCFPAAVALDAASEGAWALASLLGRPTRAQREAHFGNLRDLLGPLLSVVSEIR
jgi:Ser/Thr protein kinase RdoA (MazF antagonist)